MASSLLDLNTEKSVRMYSFILYINRVSTINRSTSTSLSESSDFAETSPSWGERHENDSTRRVPLSRIIYGGDRYISNRIPANQGADQKLTLSNEVTYIAIVGEDGSCYSAIIQIELVSNEDCTSAECIGLRWSYVIYNT